MPGDDDENAPVKAKAFLIDPVSMTVVWANESAAGDLAEGGGAVAIERAVPVAGITEALRAVAETGVPRHLSAGLISSGRGSVSIVASVHRLPDGKLLLLTENAFQARGRGENDAARQHRRR